ncbi:MAG: hypothetical protein LJE68_16690 [Rhodobacter sp.]|nr:hypothetical protein [Rhodobacter sp.]
MPQDLMLVAGIFLTGLAIPSILGAVSDRRSPRTAAIAVLIGGTLILLAVSQKPGGYTLRDVPQAFVRVVAHFTK